MKQVFSLAALSLLMLAGADGADKKPRYEFQVRAVSYRAFPHENINASTFPACYGRGDSSFWVTMHLNCETMTTPPPAIPPPVSPVVALANSQFIEVYNLVEAGDSIYAITCKGKWIGDECAWLLPDMTFQAEVQDWTMWVTLPRSANQKKDIRVKFRLLDVQRQSAAPVSNSDAALPGAYTPGAYAPGSYWGVVRSAPLGVSVRFGIAIGNENGSLKGCMSIDAPLYGSGEISGTIKGKDISFEAIGSSYALKFLGELQGSEMKGTYAVAPDDDDGAFALRRLTTDASPAGSDIKDCLKSLISLDPPGPSPR